MPTYKKFPTLENREKKLPSNMKTLTDMSPSWSRHHCNIVKTTKTANGSDMFITAQVP